MFTGVLEDFEGSTDDLYEAVGPILMEMDSHATEEGILAICGKLHHSLDLEWVIVGFFICVCARATRFFLQVDRYKALDFKPWKGMWSNVINTLGQGSFLVYLNFLFR